MKLATSGPITLRTSHLARWLVVWALFVSVLLGFSAPSTATVRSVVSRTHVAVWLKADVTNYQVVQLGRTLKGSGLVHGCTYRTKREDYREAKEILTKSEFAKLSLEMTPTKYVCDLDRRDFQEVANRFRPLPGVYQVAYAIRIVQ